MRAIALLPALAGLLPGAATQAVLAEDRGFTADDLVRLERVSDPQLSPDGRRLVYVQRETDMAANTGRTDLWLLDLTRRDAVAVRLTTHEANDGSPRFAPSGEAVYFLSTRSGSSQLWRLPLAGGEAVQVTNFPVAVDSFRVSPAGDRIAFAARVFRDCADLACTRQRLDARAKGPTGRTYDALFVRHWDRWNDGRRNVLHVLPLGADGLAAGEPRALTAALDGDVPSTPFGGAEEYAFSPDGARLAFAARVAGREEAWSTNLDLYEVAVSGGEPVNLTVANPATDTMPVYSPDGRYLAWKAMARAGFEADRYAIMLGGRSTGERRERAAAWDR